MNRLINDTNKISVETQSQNLDAISFYEKNNYKLTDQKYIYHFWL